MEIVQGDLFSAKADVVMHQCNCFCVWGSGVAKQMKEEFPEAYALDRATGADKSKFGDCSYAKISRENKMGVKFVFNLYGQIGYGRDHRMTGYAELESALSRAFEELDKIYLEKCEIAIPYLIGCGLAGGDERTVVEIIDRSVEKYGSKFHVTAYKI